jgi:hypothetical protein
MSQELTDGDRKGTINGFQALRTAEGDEMAKTVSERADLLKEAKK